ncbi:MAG: hypothetical protein LC105_05660 [Chitinophagales bacterium]|nr:hypothetical protein [Chitinophagales bacterium]MCZ2393320.1 hypothetical protein [Chitinophagales bacterium]
MESANESSGFPTRQRSKNQNSVLSGILNHQIKQQDKIERLLPSQEVIANLWNEFLESGKEKLDSFFMSFANTSQVLWKEPNIICFELPSNIAQGTFNHHKVHFSMFFSERLLNVNQLTFEYNVVKSIEEEEPKSKAYTLKERIDEAILTNPAIQVLIDKFDLDF